MGSKTAKRAGRKRQVLASFGIHVNQQSCQPRSAFAPCSKPGNRPNTRFTPLSEKPSGGFALLPDEMLQNIADFLSSFRRRQEMRGTCKVALSVDWRLARPGSGTLLGCMSSMNLGDAGARAVAQALARYEHTTDLRLHLSNNGITDDGARALATAIAASSKVKRLYLQDNKITDVGAKAISHVLDSHSFMLEVDLRGNLLSREGMALVRTFPGQKQFFVDWSLPNPSYMTDKQEDITARMRCILLDWLLDVYHHKRFPRRNDWEGLFFTACNVLDRYLSVRAITRKRLQLIGVSVLFLSVPRRDDSRRDVDDTQFAEWLANMTDNSYTTDEVLATAFEIQETLGSNIFQVTAHTLVVRYLTFVGSTLKSFLLVEYLLSLASLSYELLKHPPHVLAAACMIIAHSLLGNECDGAFSRMVVLPRLVRLDFDRDLEPCVQALSSLHLAVHKKDGTSGQSISKEIPLARVSCKELFSKRVYRQVAHLKPTPVDLKAIRQHYHYLSSCQASGQQLENCSTKRQSDTPSRKEISLHVPQCPSKRMI